MEKEVAALGMPKGLSESEGKELHQCGLECPEGLSITDSRVRKPDWAQGDVPGHETDLIPYYEWKETQKDVISSQDWEGIPEDNAPHTENTCPGMKLLMPKHGTVPSNIMK